MTAPSAAELRLARIAAGATAALLAVAAVAALRGARPSDVVFAIAAAFVPYAGLVRWPLARDARSATRIALALALAAGLVLVSAPPALSDDVYRYLWDARVLRHGIDPYAYAPSDPALVPLRDALHARVNNASLPTIYPPLAQLVFFAADSIAHAPWPAKLLALAAHLATVPVVAGLARNRAITAAPLYALNPLALEEAALGGHVDAFAALFVALGAWAMVRDRWNRAALALSAATAIKLVGLPLVPLLARAPRMRGVIAIAISITAGVTILAPVSGAGHAHRDVSGLGHYARRWRGNESGFALLAEGSRLALDVAGMIGGAPRGWIRLPWLAELEGTPLDPRAAWRREKKAIQHPASFETRQLGELAARALAAVIVLGVALAHVPRRSDPLRASRDVVLALLLFAPQVHPWYLAWLLPLEVACGGIAGLAWSASILIAYAPLDVWLISNVWEESSIARAIEYFVVIALLIAELTTNAARVARERQERFRTTGV